VERTTATLVSTVHGEEKSPRGGEGEGAMAPAAARWLRREVFVGLALGQFVSLLITSTGFSSSELARRGTACRRRRMMFAYSLDRAFV
jgi:hypothetical protein